MSEVTMLLSLARAGDTYALRRAFEIMYPELRRAALARVDACARTLTPTVIVHEAFARLATNDTLELNDRRHLLACASKAMRALVIDYVRHRTAQKRGGLDHPESIHDSLVAAPVDPPSAELLTLDRAMDRLTLINPRQREVVELRYFGGYEFLEIAHLLGCSERTAKREWDRARAFLYTQMSK